MFRQLLGPGEEDALYEFPRLAETANDEARGTQEFWMSDANSVQCHQCAREFHVLRRRHHCRLCGRVFCAECSSKLVPGENLGLPGGTARLCDRCGDMKLPALSNFDLRRHGARTRIGQAERETRRRYRLRLLEGNFMASRSTQLRVDLRAVRSALLRIDGVGGGSRDGAAITDASIAPVTDGLSDTTCDWTRHWEKRRQQQNRAALSARGDATVLFRCAVTRLLQGRINGVTDGFYADHSTDGLIDHSIDGLIDHSTEDGGRSDGSIELYDGAVEDTKRLTRLLAVAPTRFAKLVPRQHAPLSTPVHVRGAVKRSRLSALYREACRKGAKARQKLLNDQELSGESSDDLDRVTARVLCGRQCALADPNFNAREHRSEDRLVTVFDRIVQSLIDLTLNRHCEFDHDEWRLILYPLVRHASARIRPDAARAFVRAREEAIKSQNAETTEYAASDLVRQAQKRATRVARDENELASAALPDAPRDIRELIHVATVVVDHTNEVIGPSRAVDGVVLHAAPAHRSMPSLIQRPAIVLLACALDFATTLEARSLETLEVLTREHAEFIDITVAKVLQLLPNVVFVQGRVDGRALDLFLEAGVTVFAHVPAYSMRRLARATGARVLRSVDHIRVLRNAAAAALSVRVCDMSDELAADAVLGRAATLRVVRLPTFQEESGRRGAAITLVEGCGSPAQMSLLLCIYKLQAQKRGVLSLEDMTKQLRRATADALAGAHEALRVLCLRRDMLMHLDWEKLMKNSTAMMSFVKSLIPQKTFATDLHMCESTQVQCQETRLVQLTRPMVSPTAVSLGEFLRVDCLNACADEKCRSPAVTHFRVLRRGDCVVTARVLPVGRHAQKTDQVQEKVLRALLFLSARMHETVATAPDVSRKRNNTGGLEALERRLFRDERSPVWYMCVHTDTGVVPHGLRFMSPFAMGIQLGAFVDLLLREHGRGNKTLFFVIARRVVALEVRTMEPCRLDLAAATRIRMPSSLRVSRARSLWKLVKRTARRILGKSDEIRSRARTLFASTRAIYGPLSVLSEERLTKLLRNGVDAVCLESRLVLKKQKQEDRAQLRPFLELMQKLHKHEERLITHINDSIMPLKAEMRSARGESMVIVPTQEALDFDARTCYSAQDASITNSVLSDLTVSEPGSRTGDRTVGHTGDQSDREHDQIEFELDDFKYDESENETEHESETENESETETENESESEGESDGNDDATDENKWVGDSVIPLRISEPASWVAHCLDSSNRMTTRQQRPNVERLRRTLHAPVNPAHSEHMHMRVRVDSSATVECTVYYAARFRALRRAAISLLSEDFDVEQAFVDALSHSDTFEATGGKSRAHFGRTRDDRFVVKFVSKSDVEVFLQQAREYFAHWSDSFVGVPSADGGHFERRASLLEPLLGVYKVKWSKQTANLNETVEFLDDSDNKEPDMIVHRDTDGADGDTADSVGTGGHTSSRSSLRADSDDCNDADDRVDLNTSDHERASSRAERKTKEGSLLSEWLQQHVHYLMVMPNLFFGSDTSDPHKVWRVFDLKGSRRNRYARYTSDNKMTTTSQRPVEAAEEEASESAESRVLLDSNFTEWTRGMPLGLVHTSHQVLRQALWRDSDFLCRLGIVDYSLLVGVHLWKHRYFDERHAITCKNLPDKVLPVDSAEHLRRHASDALPAISEECTTPHDSFVAGIIDYFRLYSLSEFFEEQIKSVGRLVGAARPTVTDPETYRDRFRQAVQHYFADVPAAADCGDSS